MEGIQREPDMFPRALVYGGLVYCAGADEMSLRIIPLELDEANDLVTRWHRHHKPAVGHRFSIGVVDDSGEIVGAAIVGRPVARLTDYRSVLEVTRLVTNGTKNACSILYAAAARVAREMGYEKIQTFILDSETGVSLIAAGWEFEGHTSPADGKPARWHSRGGRRSDQPEGRKGRYGKRLNTRAPKKISTPMFQEVQL
jgi:hypothetical protein